MVESSWNRYSPRHHQLHTRDNSNQLNPMNDTATAITLAPEAITFWFFFCRGGRQAFGQALWEYDTEPRIPFTPVSKSSHYLITPGFPTTSLHRRSSHFDVNSLLQRLFIGNNYNVLSQQKLPVRGYDSFEDGR